MTRKAFEEMTAVAKSFEEAYQSIERIVNCRVIVVTCSDGVTRLVIR